MRATVPSHDFCHESFLGLECLAQCLSTIVLRSSVQIMMVLDNVRDNIVFLAAYRKMSKFPMTASEHDLAPLFYFWISPPVAFSWDTCSCPAEPSCLLFLCPWHKLLLLPQMPLSVCLMNTYSSSKSRQLKHFLLCESFPTLANLLSNSNEHTELCVLTV